MQLLIILALLLYGGKSNAKNLIEEVKPVIENFGGEEMKQALKSAEELSTVLSAVQELATSPKEPTENQSDVGKEEWRQNGKPFPLAPVSEIADREITYSLSRYFAKEA